MPKVEIGDTHAKITPEAIAGAKARIGKFVPDLQPANRSTMTEAHVDTIRRYAFGIGDDNPLWCDPSYGPKTRWKSTIAFPTLEVGGLQEELPPGGEYIGRGDPLRGLHNFIVGFDTTYYRPVYPGDRCSKLSYIEDVQVKEKSEFSGMSVKLIRTSRLRNQRGDLVKVMRVPLIHTERSTSQHRKKYKVEEIDQKYTDAQLDEIDAAYAAESRRGAEPRYWEDVAVGDEIPGVVKGPYTLTDWIGYCVGVGMFGAFGSGPWRLDYLNRLRVPKFYLRNANNIPRASFACHFEKDVANQAGVPLPYDLGAMREAFLVHMLCNWMGDDGFIHKTFCEFRRFNMIGDTQWCRGKVVGKRKEDDLNMVEIEMHCINQRGEITTPGSAVVLLPSRESGPVKLPDAPRDLP